MKLIKRAVQAGLVGVLGVSAVFAQNIDDAKKAIDAEKYQQAKTILNGLISSRPSDGINYFYLGNVYLKNEYADSAKTFFSKGVSADADFPLNYVGLGTVDLLEKKTDAASTQFTKAISLAKKKDYTPYLYIGRGYLAVNDFTKAIENLEKAKAINEKDAGIFMSLGEAYNGNKQNSEAFSAFRTATDLDKTMYRAKLEQAKTIRRSKAFQEAADQFNAILTENANYAPAYRELAETYYQWAKDQPSEYQAKIKQALEYYQKFMDLTDRSLDSRMRYADFLVLAGEYKQLETEAQAMAQMDKANPRIYRYLGYSAYENGHFAESISALNTFMSKVAPERIIAQDYFYLGRAKIASNDTTGVSALAKAVAIDSSYSEPISELAKAKFGEKNYALSGALYSLAVQNSNSKSLVLDHFYIGMSNYFNYAGKTPEEQKANKQLLVEADSAFSFVAQKSPSTPDTYIYRGRVNRLLDDDQNSHGYMVPFYEKYISVVLEKPEAAADARYKRNLAEAYNNLGAFYARTNQAKAKEYFSKTVALDPANEYAAQMLKSLAN